MLRYQNRRNRQLDEREQAVIDKKESQKTELKSFLLKQIQEKEGRESQEKAENAEQAVIWKKEKVEFDAFEKTKHDKIKKAYKEFSD